MPELPEVETTVRGLRPVLENNRLTLVEARRPDLRRVLPPDLRQRLTGARVTGVRRRGKYGLIDTDRDAILLFHLGMSGHWRIDPAEIGAHDHLLIETDAGRRLALNDARRFGSIDLLTRGAEETYPALAALGIEPLSPDLTAFALGQRLAGRKAPIKAMLMDQRILAGIGNIYACEALNLARIAAWRPAGRIARARLERLVEALVHVLEAAISAGGSSLRDFKAPDGTLGDFPLQYRVYGREGAPCPCGMGMVRRRVEGGRSTFHCPACQR